MKVFVVVDIGCIECGEPTDVLGIFKTEGEADAAVQDPSYFNGGQHHVQVFEVEVEWL
jgi:hypothetical protein